MNTNPADKNPTALIVPHTHWDREWRYPIWKNRALLVRFMSELLDILDKDPAYACFVMDGQVVVINDYLEVCPEDRERISRHVRDGRLKIGPWYTLPDLYPVDGECLVRNLLRGIRESAQFGGHLRVGYNSFGWGQIAQFPQIYAGFGMRFVIAAKRVSQERAPNCEFWWEGPDGTRILASRLGRDARANGFFQMYIPVRHGMPYRSPDYRWQWGESGAAIHRAETDRADNDYFRVDKASGYYHQHVNEAMEKAWIGMEETLLQDFRLILTGSDFSSPLPILTRIIRDANVLHPDRNHRMGTLEEYADELEKRLDPAMVPVVTGELRDGPAFACSGNALSSRIYIKQLNKQAENALLRRTEPAASALSLLGEPWPEGLFNLAWKHLLEAHPHDSINGVTQDKTANDTVYRLEQALELAEVIFEESMQRLACRLDYTGYATDEILVLLFNPRPFPAREVIDLCLDTPTEHSTWEIGLIDADGTPLASQQLSRREMTCPVDDMEARPWPFHFDRHRIFADTGEVPAGGYKLLRAVARQSFERDAEWWPAMRTSTGNDIARNPTTLENAFLRVSIQSDGCLSLMDKATGTLFTGLHWFEDTGDVGDYWAYYPPYANRTYTSRGVQARIWLEENGPLSATIGIEIDMDVPAGAHFAERGIAGESSRKSETTRIRITSLVSLRQNARRLEIRTEIDNTAEDHRMRVMFPTSVRADSAQSGGHFMVNSRPAIPPRDAQGTFWPEMQTLPQQMFVDVSDGTKGLALINDCLTEYQLLDDEPGTLALTLFRSVRNRICTEFRSSGSFPRQKGGQCLRRLKYHYAICPHAGSWDVGAIYSEAMAFNTPLAALQLSPCTTSQGDLPKSASLFSIDSEQLVLTAFKRAEDRNSHIVRLFNPTGGCIHSALRFNVGAFKAWRINLDESRLEEMAVQEGVLQITVHPAKILSIEIGRPE